jgi:hypothetical protein
VEAFSDRPPVSDLAGLAGAARVAPFTTSHEHAAALIQVVTRRCAAALAAHRALGLIDDDAGATRILARLPDGELASLEAALAARTAAASDAGAPIALPDAFDAWHLPAIDRAILEALIAARCSPVVARLLAGLGGVTVAGIAAVLGPGSDGVVALDARLAPSAPLRRLALIDVRDPDEAFLDRRLAADPRLAALLTGTVELDDALPGARLQRARDPRVERWAPPAVHQALRSAIADGAALPITELAADGAAAIAADAALSLARPALRVTSPGDARWLDALAREALLHRAAVIVEGDAPDALVQRLAALPIPIVATAIRTVLPVRRIELALPGAAEREAHWRDALAGIDHDIDLGKLARLARVGPDAITRAAAHAALLHDKPTRDDLLAALRAQLPDAPRPLATSARWEDLVLPAEVPDRVRDFLAAVREQRLGDGAFGERARLAITGPTGTGKTALATAIARELELPLVELTSPTPTAVAAAISAAERGLILLAADDTSHDAVAELRAPLLHLSRDAVRGAIVLAAPGQEARHKLWRLALGGILQVADLGLDELARDHALTGAQIQVVARRAAQIVAATHKPLTRPILRELARRTLGGHLA